MENFHLRTWFAPPWKVPFGLAHEILIPLKCVSSSGRFGFTNAGLCAGLLIVADM